MRTMTAVDVMHPEVLGVRVDMTAREAADFLTDHEIAGAPVLDDNGHLVGVMSLTDLAQNEVDSDEVLVRDIMTPAVFTVPDDTPVSEIARAMIAGRIHRLFVTCQRRVVGIVTPMDLLQLLTGEGPGSEAAELAVPTALGPSARGLVDLSGPRRRRPGA